MKTLKIQSLDKGWCDRDYILLHASFQILKDFIEKEDPFRWTRKNDKFKKQLLELYNYWLNYKDSENYEEENRMLFKLIKLRKHLWS